MNMHSYFWDCIAMCTIYFYSSNETKSHSKRIRTPIPNECFVSTTRPITKMVFLFINAFPFLKMYFCKYWQLLRSRKPTLGFDQRLGAKVSWYAFHSEDVPVPKNLPSWYRLVAVRCARRSPGYLLTR